MGTRLSRSMRGKDEQQRLREYLVVRDRRMVQNWMRLNLDSPMTKCKHNRYVSSCTDGTWQARIERQVCEILAKVKHTKIAESQNQL